MLSVRVGTGCSTARTSNRAPEGRKLGYAIGMAYQLKCVCGTCHLCRARRRSYERYHKDPEWAVAKLAANRKWRERVTDDWRERERERNRRRIRDPRKKKCQNRLQSAVRRRKIIRGLCEVCGSPQVEGHHEDYDKPYEVRWLCRKHHRELS